MSRTTLPVDSRKIRSWLIEMGSTGEAPCTAWGWATMLDGVIGEPVTPPLISHGPDAVPAMRPDCSGTSHKIWFSCRLASVAVIASLSRVGEDTSMLLKLPVWLIQSVVGAL